MTLQQAYKPVSLSALNRGTVSCGPHKNFMSHALLEVRYKRDGKLISSAVRGNGQARVHFIGCDCMETRPIKPRSTRK